MIQGIGNPEPKCSFGEEDVLLAQSVQLRVAIQHSGRDELIKDADDERWEYSEDDVVK